jgi:hypothetical protein
VSRRATSGSVRVGTAVVGPGRAVAKVGAVASPGHAGAAVWGPFLYVAATPGDAWRTNALSTNNRVVQNGAGASLPVIHQALADLPDGTLNALRGALNLDYPLGRLRQHLLLCHHAHTRHVLNVLDLETLTANDGAHLVVRDEQFDRCVRESQRRVTRTFGHCGIIR